MFYKVIKNGCISAIGVSDTVENAIAELEYNAILDTILNRPTAPDGYGYRLREDLTWEMYELPIVEEHEEELTTEEAYNIIMGVSE